jgi:hypothetical protein
MKKMLCVIVFIASILCVNAQINFPQPSSTQTIIQDFGLGKITLIYSRPSIKNRTVFAKGSELAPLGKLWRTGANAATKLHFTDFVTMGNKDLDSGTYVLYTIPGAKEWTIIINKGINNWGSDGYKETDDIVRFTVPSYAMSEPVETFTLQFANIKPESCELHLMWGKTAVVIPVITKIKDRLRTQIEAALQGDKKPYFQAANFYYEWDKNYSKALENADAAVKQNPDAFYMYLLKAKIEKAAGDKTSAKTSAQKCIELATKANNAEYVKQATELIKIL